MFQAFLFTPGDQAGWQRSKKKVEYGQVEWASVKPTLSLNKIVDLEGRCYRQEGVKESHAFSMVKNNGTEWKKGKDMLEGKPGAFA